MSDPKPGAREGLLTIESARRAAADSARRPGWLNALFAVLIGVAFGFAMLKTPTGWIVGAVVFVLGMVGFLVIDTRLRRRKGRLLNFNGRSALRFLLIYATIFVIGQVQPPATWQPWFAITAGSWLAIACYIYLRMDDADTAQRLAKGNFNPNDLMP